MEPFDLHGLLTWQDLRHQMFDSHLPGDGLSRGLVVAGQHRDRQTQLPHLGDRFPGSRLEGISHANQADRLIFKGHPDDGFGLGLQTPGFLLQSVEVHLVLGHHP